MKNIILLLILGMGFSKNIHAQKVYNTKLFASQPLWIQMMDDPNVNYFIAQEAFSKFWENKNMPLDEEEMIGEKGFQNLKNSKNIFQRIQYNRELRKMKEIHEEYFYQCKRFKQWLLVNKPYVQEDGRILSPEERLEIFNKQKRN